MELASLAEPTLIPQAVAAPLGIRAVAQTRLEQTLQDFLRPRHLLLVLDNCEHLVEACAALAEALLRACPTLRILATSREPLRIPGEITRRVPSLSLPGPAPSPIPAHLLEFEALGIIGAFVGGFIFSILLPGSSAGLIGSIVVAFIGAVILIALARALTGRRAAV